MQVCTSLQTDNHASTSSLSFLQAGCPSCRPTNSVKGTEGKIISVQQNFSDVYQYVYVGLNCFKIFVYKSCFRRPPTSFFRTTPLPMACVCSRRQSADCCGAGDDDSGPSDVDPRTIGRRREVAPHGHRRLAGQQRLETPRTLVAYAGPRVPAFVLRPGTTTTTPHRISKCSKKSFPVLVTERWALS